MRVGIDKLYQIRQSLYSKTLIASFASEGKKPNIIDCTIESITFLGSIVRSQVLIGNNKFYMDTFDNPFLELPRIGEQTQITCSREAVLVLGDAPKPES